MKRRRRVYCACGADFDRERCRPPLVVERDGSFSYDADSLDGHILDMALRAAASDPLAPASLGHRPD